MKGDTHDPKALIREAYRIEGIGLAECRSVFLDWALSLPDGMDSRAAVAVLLERYGAEEDHPMTQVLREGAERAASPARRGGRRGRART
ncbi:hypothetical protein [Marimonas lutisalis]|uniref:hypothetical protein n=1 Tax=Marimonas lutisalis TaxID=2545756 RepID=UPI0010F6279A|nr:hypothetical protein [Marimonas lutisalis]